MKYTHVQKYINAPGRLFVEVEFIGEGVPVLRYAVDLFQAGSGNISTHLKIWLNQLLNADYFCTTLNQLSHFEPRMERIIVSDGWCRECGACIGYFAK